MRTDNNPADTTRSGRLDIVLEATWLLLIFLLPVYFNPFGYQVFYFAKALLLQFGVCLLLGLYLARWFLAGHHQAPVRLLSVPGQSPLHVMVLLFGLLWVVSTVFSIMPEASFWGSLARKNGLSTLIAWIALFFIVARCVRRRSQFYRALVVLIVSAGMVSLFGVLEFADPSLLNWLSRNGRVSATDGNPLSLSCFIAMVLPANLAMIMVEWYGPHKGRVKAVKVAGFTLALALQIICLFLAQYSITILLFIPGVIFFFLLAGIYLKRKAIFILTTAALAALFLLAVIIVGQALMPRTNDTPVASPAADISVAERTGLSTLGLRVKQWTCAIDVIIDSPEVPLYRDSMHFLRRWTGYGPEMFVIASQARYPPAMKSNDTYNSVLLGQPENHYLYLAVTIGLLGLAAFLAVVLIFFYLGLRLLRRFPGRDVVYLAAALIGGMAQYCIYILFNPAAILPEFMCWLILALMVALVRMERPADDAGAASALSASAGNGASAKPGRGKIRTAMAVLVVVVFISVGFSLTFSPALADMKLGSATRTWSGDTNETMSALAEAVNLEPGEAVYYGHIGSYAFKRAIPSRDAAEKSKLMVLSTAAYEAAGRREPYLAYWSYTTGDAYSYQAGHTDSGRWVDALRCYERADILLPDDAVILNKWALALMLSGDYGEAGRKLSESRSADGEWVQTTYYMGLLDVYERCYCTAGYCFVSPVEQKIGNVGPYISFCRQLALYGGLDNVVEGLKVYSGCHRSVWVGQALLGIAEVYDNNTLGAADSFRKAAHNVPPEEAATLKEIITRMGKEHGSFQPFVKELLDAVTGSLPVDSN